MNESGAAYPTHPGRLHTMFVVAALIGLLIVQQQQLITIPQSGRTASAMPDALHGPWFTVVAWFIALFVGRRTSGGATIAITALLGAMFAIGTEALQKLSGGDAQWSDVGWDMIGMTAALCIWAARERRVKPRLAIGAAILLLGLSQWPWVHALRIDRYRDSIAPELVRFDSAFLEDLLSSNSAIALVAAPESWLIGHPVLRITLADYTWPGVYVDDPIADWRPYAALAIDVYVDGSEHLPITISIRLDDAPVAHVYRTVDCAPGSCQIVLPLDGLFERDIARVNAVVIYSTQEYAGRVVYLGRVALEI